MRGGEGGGFWKMRGMERGSGVAGVGFWGCGGWFWGGDSELFGCIWFVSCHVMSGVLEWVLLRLPSF